MIDLGRLDRISLHARPFAQRLFGALILFPNYHFPFTRTRIVVENAERLPRAGGVIYVMNHTDRFNYWPFQYWLWRAGRGFTATWVKGKYYENRAVGWAMDALNNIPIPSKGYVLTKDFSLAIGRRPSELEYGALKRLCDGTLDEAAARIEGGAAVGKLLDAAADYPRALEARFEQMMTRVVAINREALAMGLSLLIFPQGTRSIRLTKGHTGAAQIALATGATVIPIGCSGSDRAYPGNSPFSRGGLITYRVGEPLTDDVMRISKQMSCQIQDQALQQTSRSAAPRSTAQATPPFVPFTASAARYADRFAELTGLWMDRINDLVDPEYRYDLAANAPAAEGVTPDGERGGSRFL